MKTPFVVTIIEKVVEQIGAVLVLDPECKYVGHITFKKWEKTVFRSTHFSINGFGAAELAKDKGSSSFFSIILAIKFLKAKLFLMRNYANKLRR